MDATTAGLIGLGILAVVAIVFAMRFGGEGKLIIDSFPGLFKFKGRNRSRHPTTQAGALVEDVDVGENLINESRSGDAAITVSSKIGGSLTNRQIPDQLPPKV